MFWKKKQQKTDMEKIIKDLTTYLLLNGIGTGFSAFAKEKSKNLELIGFNQLRSLLHKPPEESEIYSASEHGLGGWLSACQFSIFELVYNHGEKALPFIREIAWGEYDWTQGNAIELLIRFASDGIKREEIITEIKEKFPKIRFEAQLYSIQPLLPKLSLDENLEAIFNELMDIEDFREAYEELTE